MDRRALLHRTRALRRGSTPAEQALWEIVRGRRCLGFKFRRQTPFRGFVIDFFCRELALAIEVDGGIHDDDSVRSRDTERDRLLAACGLRVIRIPNDAVSRSHIEEIIKRLPPLRVCGEGVRG
jgi:very-short-patch-repair endonuclease